MKVISTAGHVDHGKSKLVEALTGMNPDRLQEEQERQMTIDLGFAWLTLPYGESVGIIDVPGHRDFIENMLAGVGGIDAALLVIAADEGIMPQTREHLAIIDLLEIQRGVVGLTKVDLIEDNEWLDLVRSDVAHSLELTHLKDAPIIPVSAVTGAGLRDLIQALSTVLQESSPRSDLGRPRLLIDRVFTMAGFGTVVTGTLIDGTLRIGQEVEILPRGLKCRIRGLQTHRKKIEEAIPGSRVAANLTGIAVQDISRGDVVVHPNTYQITRLLDVQIKLLPDAAAELKHDQQVKLFLGSAQRLARVRVLGEEKLRRGKLGWLQLVLEYPIVTARGDHFILRRPSPGATLGGGKVADPHPKRRHRRKDESIRHKLESFLQGSPSEILDQTLTSLGPVPLKQAIKQSGLDPSNAQEAIDDLEAAGHLRPLEDSPLGFAAPTLVISEIAWRGFRSSVEEVLMDYHERNPLRIGIPREELKSRLRHESRIFNRLLEHAIEEGWVQERAARLRSPRHSIALNQDDQQRIGSLTAKFKASPFSPPSVKECVELVGNDLLAYLLDVEELIQVSPDVVFLSETYEKMVDEIRGLVKNQGRITVAEIRDYFQTTRKYALALMEHLDAIGITIRDGDYRQLAPNNLL